VTTAPTGGFVHPGVVVDKAQLDLTKSKLAAGQEPWKSAFAKLQNTGGSQAKSATCPECRRTRSYRYASLDYAPAPTPYVQQGTTGTRAYMAAHPELGLFEIGGPEQTDDAVAAYTHALQWYYTGDARYAAKAIEIMNAWSYTLKEIRFDQPRRTDNNGQVYANGLLQAQWGGQLWTRAAEIIRYSGAGWSNSDITQFETMLTNIFLPLTINGWSRGANTLSGMSETTMGIGVFTNNRNTFNAGVALWRKYTPSIVYMKSDGTSPVPPSNQFPTPASLKSYFFEPTSWIDGLEQETLRDLGHTMMGLGGLANTAATAEIQGVDLWGEQKTRLVAAYELHACYELDYLDKRSSLGLSESGMQSWIAANDWRPTTCQWVGDVNHDFVQGGGSASLGWEVAYNEYAKDRGVSMPYTKKLVERIGPSGPGMHLSWETLVFAQ
jgi:hypothetical protein